MRFQQVTVRESLKNYQSEERGILD